MTAPPSPRGRRQFQLPARWYSETISRLIDEELPPMLGPLSSTTAWRYIYACVLWEETVEGQRYLHLNDRLSKKSGRELAERGRLFLNAHLAREPLRDSAPVIDAVARSYAAARRAQGFTAAFQRNNVTGASFEATLQEIIDRLCGVRPLRTPRLRQLRGFELAPVGYHSAPDLALFSPRDFRVLISTKWTLRKERIGTYLHEAYFYKQRRSDLQVAFVISEFNLNIVEWLVNDPLVDRVYHVHLPMLLSVHQPFRTLGANGQVPVSRLLAGRPDNEVQAYARWLALGEKLFDLEQLFKDIDGLKEDVLAPDEPEQAGGEPDDDDDVEG